MGRAGQDFGKATEERGHLGAFFHGERQKLEDRDSARHRFRHALHKGCLLRASQHVPPLGLGLGIHERTQVTKQLRGVLDLVQNDRGG